MRSRRNPRAEQLARLIPGTPRRRLALGRISSQPAPAPAGRPRPDPRGRRAAAVVRVGQRLRIDWMGSALTPLPAAAAPAARDLPPVVRIVEEPAFLVLAVLDQPEGMVSDHDRQVIAGARLLADAGGDGAGGAVVAVVVDGADGLGAAGADRVVALPPELGAAYAPERRAAAVLAVVEALRPRHVLFAESAKGGADLARRVAASLEERLFAGADTLTAARAARRARGGAVELSRRPPRLISLAPDALAPREGEPREARPLPAPDFTAPDFTTEARIDAVRPLAVDPDALPLREADFILSAGNGVTDWASFTELGRALGATRAGSRIVCDTGHLPRDRQVGASGSVVTARCYVAFGIAGAPQHLQGIPDVPHVVAVNTDLHAAMIKRADLAVVADAQDVMPALVRYLREHSHD